METIPKSECRVIGVIRKTHGVYGALLLEYEPEFENSVAEADRFFLEVEGLLVPFFIKEEGIRFKSTKTAIVEFEWVSSETKARRFTGCRVFLFSHEIIDEEEDSTVSQYLNYQLVDENENTVGTITAVNDYSGNVVFSVGSGMQEVLIPFNEELLVSVDNDKKIMKLRIPEGLLE